ncbi:MAG: sulfite exporter TauE/SafE family protein, partial [Steroidobacteraceae bacterium]|nr:sulfite exporter TauE/SafE family protein [Steroidobacteraceae bacterium]
MLDWLPYVLALAGTGLIAGVIAGLLGVGGGIVIVPVLELLLGVAGVASEWRMHVAIATSLATIVPTSISSARAHHAHGAIDWPLVRSWSIPVIVGALLGGLLAARAKSAWLAALFGTVAL